MANFSFKYGDGHMDFSFPDEDIIKVIEPAHIEVPEGTEEEKIRAAIENPLGTQKPVSYTHLDVYKRQPFIPLTQYISHCVSCGQTRPLMAVSYTHLDVYKRQD